MKPTVGVERLPVSVDDARDAGDAGDAGDADDAGDVGGVGGGVFVAVVVRSSTSRPAMVPAQAS